MKYGMHEQLNMLEAPKMRFFIHFQLDISFGIPFFRWYCTRNERTRLL